ncbi:hypothetical protein ABIF57_001288 [Bradyrhizobium diazoefficiens]
MKYRAAFSVPALWKPKHRFPFVMRRKLMTRLPVVAAVLIAAAVYQTQAAAARDAAPRRAATHVTTDCVRAPAVGAYASAPYKQPPCLPSTTTLN